MSDVVVIGGCIVDLISYVDRFPRPGETMSGKDFCKGFGGKGANQCVMAMKLGADCSMIAKLGCDSFGNEYLQHFRTSGINYDHISQTSAAATSTASIAVAEDGQNSIIYVPGAIKHLLPNDVSAAEETIKNSKVLLCTYECPRDTLFTVLTIAKKYKIRTVVNAAPVTDPSYETLYPLIDIICLNEVEAEDSTKLPIRTLEDVPPVISYLFSKGCSAVILTLGSKGAVYQTSSEDNYTLLPAKMVQAVDTTGAGDAFLGSLVYYLSKHPNMDVEIAIQHACDVATLSVLRKGTQSSFPNREELSDDYFC